MAQTVKIDTHLQYHSAGLDEADLTDDPIELFKNWFVDACQSNLLKEPGAVCLSTSTSTGRVSSRFVLLKRFDTRGFVFFTNYESRKARELDENPRASLAFYWEPLFQQVRIGGATHKVSPEETGEYFRNRPIGSQIGAWASPQSRSLEGRDELIRLVSERELAFGVEAGSVDRVEPSIKDLSVQVPVPPHWGGIRLVPDEIEFWVGRPNRLHDRFVYRRVLGHDGHASDWIRERLAP